MNSDEIRHHLTGAAPTQQGRGGPAHEGGETMMALSVVSTDLGRLSHQVTELAEVVAGLRQGQKEKQALANQVAELAEQVTGIGKAVQDLKEKDPPQPPPQPWDWTSMSSEEEAEAILLLAAWVETVLVPWWPRTISKDGLPPCWIRHPDMRRSMSLVRVSYQQAYEHEHRRVHHEVDFRRTLEDMLRDVAAAAQAYNCRSEDQQKRHKIHHQVRPELDRARDYLRDRALPWIAQADRKGEQDRVTHLMERYEVDAERLRSYMCRQFDRYLRTIVDGTVAEDTSSPLVRETSRILAEYRVVDTDALGYAPDLEHLLKKVYDVDRDRFHELRSVYEPLLRKYKVITEYVTQMSGQPTQEMAKLMERYGITDSDVTHVRNMLLAPRR